MKSLQKGQMSRSYSRVFPIRNRNFRLLHSYEYGFYRVTRMRSADYAVARRLSVCPPVTRRYSIDTAEHILKLFYHQVALPF